MRQCRPRLDSYGYLTRVAKDPFADLAPDATKTIKSYLAPTRCHCDRAFGHTGDEYCSPRPMMCKGMNSAELRAWGQDNDRMDMILHADCIEVRETFPEAEDYMFKSSYLQDRVPRWLQSKIDDMALAMNAFPEEYNCEDMVRHVVRFKTAEKLIEEGNEAAARALFGKQ